MSGLSADDAISSVVIESEYSCRCFSLVEIQSMTNNFNEELVIGIGGFGKVYKGFIDNSATAVAIKQLKAESNQGAEEFWNEVKMLSKLRHTHLVALIGQCNDCQEMILVYEYMARGTLADHLYNRSRNETEISTFHLTWERRLNICIGAARGLDYLHTGTDQSFIHRDVKTTNILLDENWVAKIADFGLSKGTTSNSATHVSTKVKGTFGYLDPDYFYTHRLTKKSDVYAFGVVLLEVLCGRPPVDTSLKEEEISLILWAQQHIKKGKVDRIIDPSLSGQITPQCLKYFVEVAYNCLHTSPKKRPTMGEVVGTLDLALVSQRKGRSEGMIGKMFKGIAIVPKVYSMDGKLTAKSDVYSFGMANRRPSIDIVVRSLQSALLLQEAWENHCEIGAELPVIDLSCCSVFSIDGYMTVGGVSLFPSNIDDDLASNLDGGSNGYLSDPDFDKLIR
ncbi:receptor-like protein kinase FERONIA [Camellia sinensis]|uniref:receptor-like protein kinase FERONIA n=1 Tax=Camellia sinensis TaxID=4442 RepID=UPI001035C881|nr:receptor-like protein kinase FERONIA [Camellia sinensis]